MKSARRRSLMMAGMAAAALPVTLRAQECVPLPGVVSQSPRVAELAARVEGDKLIVSGRVTGSDCRPLAGALVEVFSASAEIGVSATTDDEGRFVLTTAAAPGPLQVRVSHNGHTLQT